jgi:hypothetical protein
MKKTNKLPSIALIGFEPVQHHTLIEFLRIQFQLVFVHEDSEIEELCSAKDVFSLFINLHTVSAEQKKKIHQLLTQTKSLPILFLHPQQHHNLYHDMIQEGTYYKVLLRDEQLSWSELHELTEELSRLHQYKQKWNNHLK